MINFSTAICPKAIFTKKMLEDAKKTIEELGFLDSLGRRHATLDDITVNNILFSNRDAAKRSSMQCASKSFGLYSSSFH